MAQKIILYLSAPRSDTKPEQELTYLYPSSETGTVTGWQTNEAPVKYLLREHPDVSEVLCIVTKKARERAWERFQTTVREVNPQVQCVPIPLEGKESFQQIVLPQILSRFTAGDEILLETTGGPRDAVMMLLLISRVLSYNGIRTTKAVYSNINGEKRQINDVSYLIELFDLMGGMQEMTSFGNVNALRRYYQTHHHSKDVDRLLNATEELWDSIALCRTDDLEDELQEFNEILDRFQKLFDRENASVDPIIRMLVPAFAQKFNQQLDIPGVIRWCVESNMLQQALTIYVEHIPHYFFETARLLKLPPNHQNDGGNKVTYYANQFTKYFLRLADRSGQNQMDANISTVQAIDLLIVQSGFQWHGPKELLQPICNDYLYLKTVRNIVNHASRYRTHTDTKQNLIEYMNGLGYPSLTVMKVSELKTAVLDAMDRIHRAVEYRQKEAL